MEYSPVNPHPRNNDVSMQVHVACSTPLVCFYLHEGEVDFIRVLYVYTFMKVGRYLHTLEKFSRTCIPLPKFLITSIPFRLCSVKRKR